ncbi:MAG: DUF427 domain-containing protein [Alphaproteobacteria bacterium]|nr:DUF427 domain-containing protein [Alphaproteobacteria bacterium]
MGREVPAVTDLAHRVLVEPSPKRVRVVFGGETIADTTRALLLMEGNRIPVYYFPIEDIRTEFLEETSRKTRASSLGEVTLWSLNVGGRAAQDTAHGFASPAKEAGALKGHLAFDWERMDHWFEEDEEVFVHPAHPYRRIDVRRSRRTVRIELGGKVVGESEDAVFLFETTLPVRYYLPKADVAMERLRPSPTRTHCPYKGEAGYYSARIGDKDYPDIAWVYETPHHALPEIKGRLAFYNERVDTLYIGGEKTARPKAR